MSIRLLLSAACAVTVALSAPAADFRAGAAVVDVTPAVLPVLVNGGMLNRSVSKVNTRVNARALAFADGREQIAIVVVDSCMMGRPLLDEAKALAAKRTGIATNRILISATHAHSAPSSFACLGTDADPRYVPFLRDKLVEAVVAAQKNLEPARIGWAKGNAAEFTALRQWVRRPDRLAEDPFGNKSLRANMHAGRVWDDVTGEAGPKDPDLTLISIQARDGRPLAVLGNFSMHYFGDKDISADYFGLFSEGLKARLAASAPAGQAPFVGIMSHGCSGDIYRVDYKIPEKDRPKPTIQEYADGLLDIAMKALAGIAHRSDVTLAMAEARLPMSYRVPDKQLLEWSKNLVKEMGDRLPKTTTEVYAREQIILHEMQRTEVVVQALRIGDIAIATTPTETYAVTGLKIKAASPLRNTMVIELANGADGYIPPPEQHAFGGYNTWPARSAGLEVQDEPQIAEAALGLLEPVAGQPRRAWKLPEGPATRAVLDAKPLAYWRLNEFTGPLAADATGHGHHAAYEPAITYYLDGPRPAEFASKDDINRAPHFVGGRLRARLEQLGDRYSVSLWLWNGRPNDGRDVSGWLFSRGPDQGLNAGSEHLGIGGKSGHTGKLVFFRGADAARVIAGRTEIPRWQWHHLALVRDGQKVRAYLDGQLELETALPTNSPPSGFGQLFLGGRSDNAANWEGRLDEVAVFDRALTEREAKRLAGK
ncbi:MAG: LamG-like jellyroll fold domain-containing protein [Limisphaerales bacterium]